MNTRFLKFIVTHPERSETAHKEFSPTALQLSNMTTLASKPSLEISHLTNQMSECHLKIPNKPVCLAFQCVNIGAFMRV